MFERHDKATLRLFKKVAPELSEAKLASLCADYFEKHPTSFNLKEFLLNLCYVILGIFVFTHFSKLFPPTRSFEVISFLSFWLPWGGVYNFLLAKRHKKRIFTFVEEHNNQS